MPSCPSLRISLLLTTGLLLPVGCFAPTFVDDAVGESSDSDAEVSSSTETRSSSGSDGPLSVCGDAVVEGDERCDDGINDGRYGGCSADCSALGPHCGDGLINADEPCDDGDEIDGNGCNVDCVISGTVLWTSIYDGPAHDVDTGWGIASDSSDNVIVVGSTKLDDGVSGAWIRKYTPDGASIWTDISMFANRGSSFAKSVTVLSDDTILAGGSFRGGPSVRDQDIWFSNISQQGEHIWTKTYASPQNNGDRLVTIRTASEGSFFVLLEENMLSETNSYSIRKHNLEGSELWTRHLGQDFTAWDLAVLENNTAVAAGSIRDEYDGFIPHIVALSTDGDTTLERSYPQLARSSFHSVTIDNSDNIVATTRPVAESARVLTFNSAGEQVGEFFPHPNSDIHFPIAVFDRDNNLIAAGTKGEDYHLWVSKYSPDGVKLWTNIYNGDDEWGFKTDVSTAVTTDSKNNILVTAFVDETNATMRDIWTAKIAP